MDFLKKVLAFIQAHWITVIAICTILWTVDKPYVEAYVSAHPLAAIIYANIAAIISFYIKSPTGGVLMMLRLKKKVGE